MAVVLTHVGDTWGGAAGYLGAYGVDAVTLDRVRVRLLDS